MEEQATFERRAVLAPRRARRDRLALLLPLLAVAVVAWAGSSGPSTPTTAEHPQPTVVVVPSRAAAVAASSAPGASEGAPAPRPDTVLGIKVRKLADVEPSSFDRDEVLALTGWYLPTAVTDCPQLAAIYRDGQLPYVRGDRDKLAFCDRAGVLYASEPDLADRLPTNNLEDNRSKSAGLPAVAVSVVVGVIMPLALERPGADPSEVVVLGHFVDPGGGCQAPAGCRRDLVVDYLGWSNR
jgi:hypothetical protein